MQYYDWETNVCHRYDWLEDNSFSQVESDTEIPVDIDPSQESQYFPDFEPQRLERMVRHSFISTTTTIHSFTSTLFPVLHHSYRHLQYE